ncbi:hypothetical protein GXW78_17025 [Roseomonas terrae]|uniref:Uncharacterized protein n=1 Tax=Neoroseomonas terrae TaxID=424799 RepID=A0ABS5EK23_9PROT|nr:hypothetical protein [Neoroseomonas terrae]MBR0651378.1 hypothetical protein [Neoroseomonas terrae]
MEDLVRNAINQRAASVDEAAALAEGYCFARYPALPATTLRDAVDHVLMTLQIMRAAPLTIDRDGQELREMDDITLTRHLSYMLRFSETGRPLSARHIGVNGDATPAAAWQLVHHMRARGFVIMAPTRSAGRGSAGPYAPNAPEAYRPPQPRSQR